MCLKVLVEVFGFHALSQSWIPLVDGTSSGDDWGRDRNPDESRTGYRHHDLQTLSGVPLVIGDSWLTNDPNFLSSAKGIKYLSGSSETS